MTESTMAIVFLAGMVVGGVIRAPHAVRAKRLKTVEERTSGLEKFLLVLAFLGMVVFPCFFIFTPLLRFADNRFPLWTGWAGAGLMAGFVLLLWRSHADLGRNFWVTVRVREDHELVTGGVYARVRHPMYSAHLLLALSQALLLHNWVAGFGFLAVMVPFFMLRIPLEERLMSDRFGEEYGDYMRRTGRILPKFGAGGGSRSANSH